MPVAVDNLPCAVGAYVLLIRLEKRIFLDIASLDQKSLKPGHYAYCGSAYGPGGIRARVSRHLRRDKPQRWHVDRLTAVGRIAQVAVRPNGRECLLVNEILDLGGSIPIPGFGSSDCRRCRAHLLAVPPAFCID
jgi:Uri superfamily endonuclease